MKNITTGKVELKVGDGTLMNCYIAAPSDNESYPGIMVYQEAFGVNGYIRKVVEKIAKEGYIVIAPELFHRTAPPGTEFGYGDFSVITPHFQVVNVDTLTADVTATYNWLKENPRLKDNKIGNVGFCLGGRVSFLTNTILPVSASVSYYGGGMVPLLDRANDVHAPQLFFWGGLDKHITQDQVEKVVEAMKNTGKPFANVVISYADHAFSNDERVNNYNAKATKEAWAMTMAFFENNLV